MIMLPGYRWMPAINRDPTTAPIIHRTGIVIHSGERGVNTAGWTQNILCHAWAHFAWDPSTETYVQTDSLDARAPHAGALNRYSWGIEMPGPWNANPRSARVRDRTVALVERLGAEWITGHEHVNRNKRDPGPGVTADWWAGLGLRVYWAWITPKRLLALESG